MKGELAEAGQALAAAEREANTAELLTLNGQIAADDAALVARAKAMEGEILAAIAAIREKADRATELERLLGAPGSTLGRSRWLLGGRRSRLRSRFSR